MKYLFASIVIILAACNQKSETATTWQTIQKSLQEQFISAADGDTIYIAAGNYMFTRGLQLEGKKNLVIRSSVNGNSVAPSATNFLNNGITEPLDPITFP